MVLETESSPTAAAGVLASRVERWSAQAREIRFIVTLPWLIAAALILASLSGPGRVRSAIAVGAAAAPLALLLASLFASQNTGAEALVYIAAGFMTLAVSALAVVLSQARKEEAVASLLRVIVVSTAAVIVFDTLTKGNLLARSPFSYSPVAAARFYGIGNEISGVFLGASLLAVGVLCPTPLGAVLGGAIAALLSGMPMFGADAGGFLAALVGFASLFVLLKAEQSESPNKRRVLLRAGVGAGAIVLCLVALYVVGSGRGAVGSRTHVGEAVASAQGEKGTKSLLPLIQRKAATGVRLLFTSPWSILLVTEAGICLWLWRRHSQSANRNRAVYQAAFVGAGTLLLLNDSGVVAAATCLLFPTCVLLITAPPVPTTGDTVVRAPDP